MSHEAHGRGAALTNFCPRSRAQPAQEGEDEDAEEDEDEDEEYTPAPEISGPATEGIAANPPAAISRKRSRDDEDGDGGHLMFAFHLRGQLDRADSFEKRKERAAEEPGLLAGDDHPRLGVREAGEVRFGAGIERSQVAVVLA